MIWNLLLYALAIYGMLFLVVFLLQRQLLYLPSGGRLPQELAVQAGLRYWPSFDVFRGFIDQGAPPDAQATILVFHGNAGAAYHRGFYVDALSMQNYRVILAEYPGYGGRAGRPNEDTLVTDALETIRLTHQEYGGPLYLWGESLGCGVVSSAVRETDVPIDGLVLFLPWDTLPDLAGTHYWYLPARWLVLDKYDNIRNLEGYKGNIAVLLAEKDEVVPVKHGLNLYESITTKKKIWVFEGFRHNEVPVNPGLDWWGEVMAFLSQ